jgi:membrane-associated PAP2 superfamily phosphatase
MKSKHITHIAIVAFILTVFTIPFWVSDLDLTISGYFWKNHTWADKDAPLWYFLYHFGNIPALLLSISSLLILSYSFIKNKLIKYRKILLFFVLTMLIGPGILVNAVFKEHWGRPRPREIVQFNGEREFLKPWVKGAGGTGKSFPCGHASVGFYLIVPFWILRKKNPKLAKAVLGGGLTYGTLIGIARVVQGGHFASDVLWSGGMIYISSYTINAIMKLENNIYYETKKKAKTNKSLGIIIACISVITLGLFLLASPFHRERNSVFTHEMLSSEGNINISIDASKIEIIKGDSLEISWTAQGFGLPDSKLRHRINFKLDEEKSYSTYRKGFFSELSVDAVIKIAPEYLDKANIIIERKNPVIKSDFDYEIEKKDNQKLLNF